MPIDQMMVTITRPIEESVNSVPGLLECALDHQPRLRRDRSVLRLARRHGADAATRRCGVVASAHQRCPRARIIDTHRLTFASFPIIGYSLTSDTVPQTQLWETRHLRIEAAPEPLEWRCHRGRAGRSGARISHHARSREATGGERHGHRHSRGGEAHESDRFARACSNRTISCIWHSSTGRFAIPSRLAQIVIKNTQTGIPVRIGDVATVARGVKPVYTIVTANGKPAVLLNISRQPDSNTVEVANEVHAEIDAYPAVAAAGDRATAVLRPVGDRYRIDQERARRHPHRARSSPR